jgi:sec-independent protein translocase protein TatA
MPFPNIGPGELILILIIALVVLGPGKLPDVAASLGKSVREFRKAATDVTDAGKLDAPPAASAPAAQGPAPAPVASLAPPAVASTPDPPTADPPTADGEPVVPAGAPSRDPNLS